MPRRKVKVVQMAAQPRPRLGPFTLAPLRAYRADGIVPPNGRSRLSEFMLALALSFNDLKGLYLFRMALIPDRPGDSEVSPSAGQWNGMVIQADRLTIAYLHETLQLIKSFETEARGVEVLALLQTAPHAVRRDWQSLVNIATENPTSTDGAFANVLVKVRNNVASHYYQPKALVAGYRRHFFESAIAANNKFAFASIGRNMDETRFYFADAAAQGTLANMADGIGDAVFRKRLSKALDAVNNALEHVVEEFIKSSATK